MKKHENKTWKQIQEPIDIKADLGESFDSVKERFDLFKQQGICVRCPISGTIHNVPYRRTISKGMARALKQLYRIHIAKINDGTAPNHFADFTKLRHWGLIYRDKDGLWRITQAGIDFVEKKTALPKYCVVVNNVRKFHVGDALTIDEVL